MFEDAISLFSIFASMNSWLTPTVLFLLLNLMIGTIAVTSGFTSQKPSNNNNHHNNHPQPIFHHHHHHIYHPQPPPLQPTLTRSPSVLQRLKSTINFSSFYSQQQQQPPTTYFQPPPQQQQQPDPEPKPEPEPEVDPNITSNDAEGPTLDEVYNRIKQGNSHPHYGRQNSDTKPSNGEIPVKLSQKMKKSASDMSAFNHFEHQEIADDNVGPAILEDVEDDVEEREYECVDAKADDFINRFKLQLQLQRKESMLREYKQMIHSRTTDVQ